MLKFELWMGVFSCVAGAILPRSSPSGLERGCDGSETGLRLGCHMVCVGLYLLIWINIILSLVNRMGDVDWGNFTSCWNILV